MMIRFDDSPKCDTNCDLCVLVSSKQKSFHRLLTRSQW